MKKLKECPQSPNCVSSQSTDDLHRIEPLRYSGTSKEAMASLVVLLNSMKRAKIVIQTENYLHIEFTSALCQFVDDVEFVIDAQEKVIHVRSASRVGYSDLGANRKRVEKIREVFSAKYVHSKMDDVPMKP